MNVSNCENEYPNVVCVSIGMHNRGCTILVKNN